MNMRNRSVYVARLVIILGFLTVAATAFQGERRVAEGYTDTPFLPGGEWRVHDLNRPHPEVVTPGATPGAPPSDAIVLFDGTDLSEWMTREKPRNGGGLSAPRWKLIDGVIEAVPGTGDLVSKQKFRDVQLHIEWAAPKKVASNSQGRGNSGVMLFAQYEIQVLDSYDNVSYADGQAGSIYGQYPPMVNVAKGPGEWQTYDIVFEAPEFDGDRVEKPAYVTVIHNGVVLHHRKAMIGPMRHKVLTHYSPHEDEGPILLQSHGNTVRYRNIWVRKLDDLWER
jgi:3-keto-disaccharide hydrolase